jgi:hypothetical protein
MTRLAKCPNSAIALPSAGAAEAPDPYTSPNPTATNIARAVFSTLLSLSDDFPRWLPARYRVVTEGIRRQQLELSIWQPRFHR